MKLHKVDENTILFNTGRLYTDDGQIIIARNTDDGILFSDISRGIYGRVHTAFLPSAIDSAYMDGSYSMDVDFGTVRSLEAMAVNQKHEVEIMTHAHVAAIMREEGYTTDGELRSHIGDDWMGKAYANCTIVRTTEDKIRLGRSYS